jgi:tRNA(Ile)-lysidine synthase
MLEKIITTIDKYKMIESGDTVILALSGGPDSVSLLHALISISRKRAFTIHALHVNHQLRGEESDADEEYVRQICGESGIPLRVHRADIMQLSKEKGISVEEAGREERYRVLEEYADQVGASCIALAHNKNDQAETIFMNMIRGTGLRGLTGIDYKRGRIIRPLLDVYRDEIEEYCRLNGLQARIDSTNLETDFTRNKIRIEVFPYINEKMGLNLTESLTRMSSLLDIDNDYLEEMAQKAYKKCLVCEQDDQVELSCDKLYELHPALKNRAIRIAIQRVRGHLKGVGSKHIEDVTELTHRARTGAVIQLPEGLRVAFQYGVLKVYLENDLKKAPIKSKYEKKLNIPGETLIEEVNARLLLTIISEPEKIEKIDGLGYNSLIQYFDYSKLEKGINLRNRRNGDIFKPFNSRGTKKLKEFFIDNKIPREKRETIPLIACGNEIVWIIGCRISDKYKITKNTKVALKAEFINLDNEVMQ